MVTGGAGFIGSHLCEKLLESGQRVLCVDNLLTGSKENIKHLQSNDNFVFVEHDIIDPLFIEEPIDEIYNLACPASPVQYQKNAIRTIKANTIGVINMLGLARAKQAKILQASTSEVYGEPQVSPQTEEYRGNVSCIGPRACYDEGKRCAETLFFDYHRTHHISIKIVRIFNTYGPRMACDDGRVVSNFITKALQSEPIELYGNGLQTRSFCYVDDLVRGIIAIMDTPSDITGPVNLGNSNELSVVELAKKIILLTQSNSAIVNKALPTDDPTNRCPNLAYAHKLINWKASIDLEHGLGKTIEYFRSKL